MSKRGRRSRSRFRRSPRAGATDRPTPTSASTVALPLEWPRTGPTGTSSIHELQASVRKPITALRIAGKSVDARALGLIVAPSYRVAR